MSNYVLGKGTLFMKNRYTFEFYKDVAGFWRWRLKAENGKIVADGGEGYNRKADVKRAVKNLIAAELVMP